MAIPNPREVAELANEIVRVEDQLSTLKARWESLFSESVLSENLEIRKPTGRPIRDDSISARVLSTLDADPILHWDAQQLAIRLNEDRKAVAIALQNLYVAGKIGRHSRGNYESLKNSDEIPSQEAA